MSLLRHIGTYTHAYIPVSEMLQDRVASLAFLRPNLQFLAIFQLLWLFFIFEKRPNAIWLFLSFFGELDFYVDLADFWALADF